MLTSIAGRSVIVTGASKGIGKGIARVFANQGAKVLVVARTLADAEACAEQVVVPEDVSCCATLVGCSTGRPACSAASVR